jgi:hypothetical protein
MSVILEHRKGKQLILVNPESNHQVEIAGIVVNGLNQVIFEINKIAPGTPLNAPPPENLIPIFEGGKRYDIHVTPLKPPISIRDFIDRVNEMNESLAAIGKSDKYIDPPLLNFLINHPLPKPPGPSAQR